MTAQTAPFPASTAAARHASGSGASISGAAHPGAPLVTLAGIDKVFQNGTIALSGLDLGIREGEFVSLLGPSGCGKSTALRILAGLIPASRGAIGWAGGGDAEAHQRDIGFVFQEPTLMPWASVADNVYLPLRLRGVSRKAASQAIDSCLSLVGLEQFAKSYPRELSGGRAA